MNLVEFLISIKKFIFMFIKKMWFRLNFFILIIKLNINLIENNILVFFIKMYSI